MTKEAFSKYLDELTRETGFDFDKVQKAFAYQAAKHYAEAKVGHHETLVSGTTTFDLHFFDKELLDKAMRISIWERIRLFFKTSQRYTVRVDNNRYYEIEYKQLDGKTYVVGSRILENEKCH